MEIYFNKYLCISLFILLIIFGSNTFVVASEKFTSHVISAPDIYNPRPKYEEQSRIQCHHRCAMDPEQCIVLKITNSATSDLLSCQPISIQDNTNMLLSRGDISGSLTKYNMLRKIVKVTFFATTVNGDNDFAVFKCLAGGGTQAVINPQDINPDLVAAMEPNYRYYAICATDGVAGYCNCPANQNTLITKTSQEDINGWCTLPGGSYSALCQVVG